MTEPRRFSAGDSVEWSRSHNDFTPADGWALRYVLVNAHRQIVINAAANASNTGFDVTLDGAATGAYQPGDYRIVGYAWKADDRHTLVDQAITITPNLEAQVKGHDDRTDAQRYLDRLLAARMRMVDGAARATVNSESIGGRSRTFRSLEELDTAILHARRDVNREDSARRLADGKGHPGRVRVSF